MIYDKICEIICNRVDTEPEEIEVDTALDSLSMHPEDISAIFSDIHSEFGVTADPGDEFLTVSDIVEYVEDCLS